MADVTAELDAIRSDYLADLTAGGDPEEGLDAYAMRWVTARAADWRQRYEQQQRRDASDCSSHDSLTAAECAVMGY